jgi:hypothetical protein
MRTQLGKNQSRKDDLETLGYAILDLMANGKIDFLQVDRSTIGRHISPQLHNKCVEQKTAFIYNPNLPVYDKIRAYMQDVQKLEFAEDPNYD